MFSSCYSKKYCIFVENKLHSAIGASSIAFGLHFFACEGRLFSESADRLHNGFLLLHPECNS